MLCLSFLVVASFLDPEMARYPLLRPLEVERLRREVERRFDAERLTERRL